MCLAKPTDSFQFLFCPYSSCRIMRITQQKCFCSIRHFPLHIFKIKCKSSIHFSQLAAVDRTSTPLNRMIEISICWNIHHYFILLFCIFLKDDTESAHHIRTVYYLSFWNFTAMPFFQPILHCLIIIF